MYDFRKELQGQALDLPASGAPVLLLQLPSTGEVQGRIHCQVVVPAAPSIRAGAEFRLVDSRPRAGEYLVGRAASSVACLGHTRANPRRGGLVFPVHGGIELWGSALDAEASRVEVFLELGNAQAAPLTHSRDIWGIVPGNAVNLLELGPPPHRCSRLSLVFAGLPTDLEITLFDSAGGQAVPWQPMANFGNLRRFVLDPVPPSLHVVLRTIALAPAISVAATWAA